MSTQSVTHQLAKQLGIVLLKRKIRCVVAESCTGGSLAAAMTSVPGSSRWFDRGFITYSDDAKENMLNVPPHLIKKYGAVSEETVCAMAHGALINSKANVSVAITGIAGPSGGSAEKPVGMVWIAWAGDLMRTFSHCYFFSGARTAIREQAVKVALQGLIQRCNPKTHPQMQSKENERYFFALYPPPQIAQALHQRAKTVLSACHCVPIHSEKSHITLIYLGVVHSNFLCNAMQIASQQKGVSFVLKIAKHQYCSQNHIHWFGIENVPNELTTLVQNLNNDLIPAGFNPKKSRFIPHITIARHGHPIKTPSLIPLSWAVNDFCLMKSRTTNQTHYEIIHRWPLRACVNE